MPPRDRPVRYPRNGAGDAALTAGVLAVLCAVVPIIGDYLALPVAALAVVLGSIGFVRADRGTATNPWKALTGGLLGVLAVFIVLIAQAASGAFG
ncbi:hypothetical protein [Ornithinimicrobium cavernae]|uniref:hypothetical protein n=1 Tax=Ornithinimicrobium cavernae TaxID=2666047 RepID=UPI000D69153F|nr:hypothetical protein [Ornithinimicrobium cavernae]